MKRIIIVILIVSINFINIWSNAPHSRHNKEEILKATKCYNTGENRLHCSLNLDIRDLYLNTLGTNIAIRIVPIIWYCAVLFVFAIVNAFVYSPGGNTGISFLSYMMNNIFTIPGIFEAVSFIATPVVHHMHYTNIIKDKADKLAIDETKLFGMTKMKYIFSYMLILALTSIQIANAYLMYRVF